MDPLSILIAVQMVQDMAALVEGEGEDDQLQLELAAIHSDVRSLIEAPWQEGLSRLRQSSVAGGDTRLALLSEARMKFDDVAARTAAPYSIRARASTLAACIWLGQGERGVARTDAIRALELADAAWEAMDFTPDELPNNLDGFYQLEDQARRRAEAAVRIATLSGVNLPQDARDLKRITTTVIAGSTSGVSLAPDGYVHPHAGPPPLGQCDYFGSVGRDDLATYWHQLRRVLPEGECVRWFIRATDLRVGATDSTLFAFTADRMLQDRSLTHSRPVRGITDIDTGRDWFDWFIAFKSPGSSKRIRFNLGAEEATMRSMAERLADPGIGPAEPIS
jgi:hypothetical protein